MLWVKGELLTEIEAPGLDPTSQLQRKTQKRLFDRRDWFRRVSRHNASAQPLIARVASEGALAWLFLQRESTARVSALANPHCIAFRPVFTGEPDPARQQGMMVAIARRLRAARPLMSTLTLAPLPSSDGTADLMETAFQRAGWLVTMETIGWRWTAEVAGKSFEEFWAGRSNELQSSVKQDTAKAVFETEVLARFDESAWTAFLDIWAETNQPEPSFLTELAIAEGQAGYLRLGICRSEGVPVAAQVWTVEDGVALIHGMVERTTVADTSPGTLLCAVMFGHAIDCDRVEIIEFGTGIDATMASWMDTGAPLLRMTANNPATSVGLIAAAKSRLSRLVARGTDG